MKCYFINIIIIKMLLLAIILVFFTNRLLQDLNAGI